MMETKKSNFWIGFVLGMIVLLGLGLCFYAGMQVAKKEDNKTQEKQENKQASKDEEKKDEIVELSLDDKLVTENYLIPHYICHGVALNFPKKDRTVDDLTDKEKLMIATAYLSRDLDLDSVPEDEYDGSVEKEIKEEDAKVLFEDISFFDTLKKEKDQFIGLDVNNMYYKNGKLFVNLIATGCIAEEYEDEDIYLIKAEKQGDKVMLTYAYAYVKSRFNAKANQFEESLYKEKGAKTALVKNLEYDDKTHSYNADWSKFNHYKFIIDISNGNKRIQEIKFIEAK